MNTLQRKEWLVRRKGGIGASDSPQILNQSNFGSAWSVWQDKLSPEIDDYDNFEMWMGRVMEPIIRDRFEKETGKKVVVPKDEIWSKDKPFLFATLDGEVVGEHAIVECKYVHFDSYKQNWGDQIPFKYSIQCHHQMLVTGVKTCYLAAIFTCDQHKYETYLVQWDQEIIDWMVPKLTHFWKENVKKGLPPEVGALDNSRLLNHYPDSIDESIELDTDTQSLVDTYHQAKQFEREWKNRKEKTGNELKMRLGSNKRGYIGESTITWSKWEVERFNMDRFKEENPDIYKKYINKTKSSRLTVK